ncbi:MAG: prealbumin-like fold domain-containing protein [Butyricicoccaceae bacterium]
MVKKSSQDNPVTNQLKGSLLQGAVFEVENAETGRIVDTITTDSRGIAASNPLPLGRYFVREIKAPRFYQLNTQKVEVKLKVEGDAVRIEMYNDAASIKTSIKKTGNYTVDAGDNMRYDITNVANQSNVPLDNFFWHDRIPTDAVRVGTITTGTYNARVWYKITYKTNKNGYRVLADNLLSTNRYSFKVDSGSLKLASGEYVTDIRYEFGTVPAGFKMTEEATVYVYVPPYMGNGYNITNRVDCGGSYQGEWDSSDECVGNKNPSCTDLYQAHAAEDRLLTTETRENDNEKEMAVADDATSCRTVYQCGRCSRSWYGASIA